MGSDQRGTPDDWLERKLYSRFPKLGVLLFVVYNWSCLRCSNDWVPHRARPAGRSHALPRRRRQDYNGSPRRDRIAQSAFDWSMMKAADQENFDRRRSRENPRTLERLAICA